MKESEYNKKLKIIVNEVFDWKPSEIGYLISTLSFLLIMNSTITEEEFYKTNKEVTHELIEDFKKKYSVEGE